MLYPLKFTPRFLPKIWGGRKLQTVLGKPLPQGQSIGESWELYDFPPTDASDNWASSIIENGPLAGRTLHDAVVEHGRSLHGNVPLLLSGQFPLLVKFLDAREDLSVQVHPDAEYAARHPGAHLKSEAWYIVQADPGAKLYRGLVPGTTCERFAKAIADGTVEKCIKAIEVKAGQCYYLPSGTIHALGAGILAAEVQTPSDTTFRVFDFNRIEPSTGRPRELHIEQALECINFGPEDHRAETRSHVAGAFTTVTRLVTCPYFILEKVRFSEGVEQAIPYAQPVVWVILEGQVELSVEDVKERFRFGRGDTVLLPAEMREPTIRTVSDCIWLEVTFPR